MITQALQNSHELYRQTHNKHPEYFTGFSLLKYHSEINTLIHNSNIKTCIDYGCGKARAWDRHDLKLLWGLEEVILYDPGVKQFATRPKTSADLVICVDVLEHVPEGCVDEVLNDICALSTKAVFLNISTRLASKTLIDGSNAHATVKPKQWWQSKIDMLDRYIVAHYTS